MAVAEQVGRHAGGRGALVASEVGISELQAEVRALCQELGLARDVTYRWMLGFSDVALSAFPDAHASGTVTLAPVRKRSAVGLEMTLAHARGTEWTRSLLGWWIDECELRRGRRGSMTLVVRKWSPLDDDPFH
jgi:hypothetical protein